MSAPAEPIPASVPPREAAVLQVALADFQRLSERLAEAEIVLACERCLARIERVVNRFEGRIVKRVGHQLLAVFDQPATALQAACEMQLRIARLPTLAGLRLALAIGVHHGPMESASHDSYGLTVQIATRLQQLARREQILVTAALATALPASLRKMTVPMESGEFTADDPFHPLHLVIWQDFAEHLTRQDADTGTVSPANQPAIALPEMRLRQGSRTLLLNAKQPMLTIGRDKENDLLIADAHASRRHAYIELRGRHFVLLDRSTNGTQVHPQAQPGFHLHASECILDASGRLDFGPHDADATDDSIYYAVI